MYKCDTCNTETPENDVATLRLSIRWGDNPERLPDYPYICQNCFIRTCHYEGVLPRWHSSNEFVLKNNYTWEFSYPRLTSDIYLTEKELDYRRHKIKFPNLEPRSRSHLFNITFSETDRDRLIIRVAKAANEKIADIRELFDRFEWHYDTYENSFIVKALKKCEVEDIDDREFYRLWLKRRYILSPIEYHMNIRHWEVL